MDVTETNNDSTCFDLSILDNIEKQDTPDEVKYRIPKQYTFDICCTSKTVRNVKDFITVCLYTKLWWSWIQKISPINNLDPEKIVIQVSSLSDAILWTTKWWKSKPTIAKLYFSPLYTGSIGKMIKRNALNTSVTKSLANVSGAIRWNKQYFSLYPTKTAMRVYYNNVDCDVHDFKKGHVTCNFKLQKIFLILSSSREMDIKQFKRSKFADSRICGIDPGILNFLTIYDPSEQARCIKLGGKAERFWIRNSIRKEREYSKMISLSSNNKVTDDIYNKIEDIKSERTLVLNNFFHRICKYLIENYSVINIGDFCVNVHHKNQVANYSEDCVYDIWNHARFYDILLSYGNDVCKIFMINEQNTSILCSNCGRITPMNKSRTYTCQYCKVILDRDMNAAQNILQLGYNCKNDVPKRITIKSL